MRILFVTRAYGEHAGGMERLSWELASQLQQRATLTLIAYRGPRRLAPLFVLYCIPLVLWRSRQVDIVYLGDPLLSVVGWMVMRVLNVPVVVTVHGLDILYANAWYQRYLRWFFPRLSGYVAISPYVQRLLERWGVGGRTTVIVPGTHDALFSPRYTREDLAHVVGQAVEGKIVLGTIGRLIPRKGHVWFITQVLPHLPERVLYVVAGSGPTAAAIQSAVAKTQQERRVVRLGRISAEDLKILYNTIDAFIQPNVTIEGDAEGFGIVLLEAALCQRVVFAADVEGIPAAVADGQNGYLLPSEQANVWIQKITDFINHPEGYVHTGERARHYTQAQYSWEHIGAKTLSYLQSVR